jgi:uncharacterized protein YndB with AHSA1/START domain
VSHGVARAVSAEAGRRIRAPAQRVWHLLSRLESHPRYATLWFAADVLERSPGSALVEFRGFFGGLPLTSVQRLTLRAPARIEFRQVRGELRELTGAYILTDAGGEVDLTIQIAVDAGIPLFSDAAVQQILTTHLDGTLSRLKAAAERDLVRLIPRRPRLAEAISTGEASAGETPVAAESGEEAEAIAGTEPAAQGVTDRGAAPESTAVTGGPRPGRRGRRRRRRRGRRREGTGTPGTPRPASPAPSDATL